MTTTAPAPPAAGSLSPKENAGALPPRIRRTIELVYAVEGVSAARVWYWPGHVSVGVRPGHLTAERELLRRVEDAIAGLREPDEIWDFGLHDGASR